MKVRPGGLLQFLAVGVFLSFAVASSAQTTGKSYELKLSPSNATWGNVSATSKPVLRIASGDTVAVETMGHAEPAILRLAGVTEDQIPDSLKQMEMYATAHNFSGDPKTGPIYVEGAEPGDTLEIHFLKFDFLHPYGWTQIVPGRGTLPSEFPFFKVKIVKYDTAAGTADFGNGITLKLAPFWGTVSVAPPQTGTGFLAMSPGPFGGNMDNKELVAGSTLYLPVQVPGALLSFNDSHGLQGDGEISISASETSLRGTIQVFVRKGKRLLWPRAETPTYYMTMGLDPDLNEATRMAVREMLDFLTTEKGMSREDAYLLSSLAVDLHVTEFVDTPKGVRAMVSKSIFPKSTTMNSK